MTNHDVTDAELSDYIITALAKQTGRGRGYWRRAIAGLVIGPQAGGATNWSLHMNSPADDAAQAEQVIASIRQDFPFVVQN